MTREEAMARRNELGRAINHAQAKVDTIQASLDKAMADRDTVMVSAHGLQRNGFLSYQDLRDWSGLSRSRVIQIVQGARKEQQEAG